MSLADLVIETATVEVGNTTFTVRGLCFNDITQLLRPHGEQIDIFLQGLGDDVLKEGFNLDPLELLTALPEVATLAIALVSDEPATETLQEREARITLAAAKAARMNIAAQSEALLEIGRLTVSEAGGLGKLIELLLSAVRGIRPAISQATTGIASLTE
jgi:hypothetical protein